MVDRELVLPLIGAAIALVSSFVTALVQHVLSLRADRIKRERDNKDKEVEQRRELLAEGARIMTRQVAGVYFGTGKDFTDAKIGDIAGRDTSEEGEEAPEKKPDESNV